MTEEGVFVTKNSKGTQDLARKLAEKLRGDEFIALFGDLGSGKTTFIQGLAKGLGIKQRIISPTFIIIRKYQISNISNFYHVDLYRIENLIELKNLEFEEIINSKEGIVAVEWAEKIKHLLPKKRIEIYFENISENERKITIKQLT